MLLREHASEKWFVIPPLLTNVSALPGETWTSEIESLQSFCILKNDTDLVCYIFKTHSPILIILAGNNYGIFAIISLSNFSCMFAIIFLIWSEITKVKTMHFWCHWLFVNMPFTEEDKILINSSNQIRSNQIYFQMQKQCTQQTCNAFRWYSKAYSTYSCPVLQFYL